MPSVKLQSDTVAILAGLRGRLGCGHSYDKVIQELVRREINSTTSAVMVGDRLKRIEEMVTELLIKIDDKGATDVTPKFLVE